MEGEGRSGEWSLRLRIGEIMSLMEELTVRITAEPDATFNQTLKAAEDQVEQMTGKITRLASQASITFGVISAGASLMISKWLEAANAMQVYQAKLTTVLKSSEEATATMQRAIAFAAKTPFDVQGIVNATTQIEIYGQKSEKWLPLVGDLAAGMGKRLDDTSLVIGKALSGSLEGFESLRNEFGITNAKLAQYGATMTKTGGISVATAGDLEKAKQALEAIIKTDFSGAMERQAKTFQGSLSNYKDSLVNIAATLGEQLAPAFAALLRVMTTVNNLFLQLPAPIKSVVAWGAVLGTGLAGLAAAGLGLLAVLPHIAAGWSVLSGVMGWNTGVTTVNTGATIFNGIATVKAAEAKMGFALATRVASGAMATNSVALLTDGAAMGTMALASGQAATAVGAFGGAIGALSIHPVILALGTLAIGLKVATDAWENYTKKLQEEIKRDEALLASWRESTRIFVGKSAEDLKAAGISAADVEEAIAKKKVIVEDMLRMAGEAAMEGDKKRADMIFRVVGSLNNEIQELKDKALALYEIELRYKTLENAMRDFATKMDLMGKAGFLQNPIQEVDEYRRHIEFIKPELEKTFKRKFYGDDRDFNYLISQITTYTSTIKKAKAELKNLSPDEQKGKNKEITDLEDNLNLLQGLFKAEVKINESHSKEMKDQKDKDDKDDKDRLDNAIKQYETQIQRRKDLGDLTLAQEKRLNQEKLKEMERQDKSEEDLAAQRHVITTLDYKIKEKAKDDIAKILKDELDAVKLMTTGQIAEYNRLIAKIKELVKMKKISKDDGKDLTKTALTGLKSSTDKKTRDDEKAQKDQYNKLVKVQSQYLQDVNKNSEMSVKQRIQYLESLTRFWEDMERKKVVTHEQAEEQIKAISRQRADYERSIIEANKEMEKTLRGYRKESIDYEIDKLTEKLEKGEDVESKLVEKLKARNEIELQNINDQVKEWERQGIKREKIEEGVAQLKQRLHQEEIDQIDATIEKLRQKNEEEKGEATKPFIGAMDIQQAFGGGTGFMDAAGKATRINQRNEAIAALEAEKARRQLELERAKANLTKIEAQGYDENTAQGALTGAQAGAAKNAILAGGAQKPEEVMADSTNVFAKAVELFAQTIKEGAPVTPEEADAVRGSTAGAKAGAKAGSKGEGINIVVKLDGGKAGQQGVTAQKDSQGNLKMTISKDVLATARGEVSPVGQTRFQSFLNGGSILGGVADAFA